MPSRAALVALLCTAPFPTSATPPTGCPDCGVREIRIASKILGERRVARVRLPEGYEAGSGRYPVIYVLDGPVHLDHTSASAAFLARQGAMPRVIVVSVHNLDRGRDLTPPGADRFLGFLRDELMPAVEGNLRTERFRILSGHSLGGLFALHVLATAPDAFEAYLAASPSAQWDDGRVVKELAARLKGSARLDRSLYFTLGNERHMLPAFESLRTLLGSASPAGFRWQSARFPDDGHGLVPLVTTIQGLRFTFDGYLPPVDPDSGRFAGSLEALEAHYRKLSSRLGYEVLPPEGVVNLVGYERLRAGSVAAALEAFRLNARNHPGSANAQDSLGEALEASGRMTDAVSAYERAVELGEAAGSPFLLEYRRHLRAAQRRMAEPAGPPGIGR